MNKVYIFISGLLCGALLVIFLNSKQPSSNILKKNEFSFQLLQVNRSKWQQNKLVVIPAVSNEINWTTPMTWPSWLREGLQSSSKYQVYLYQRISPNSTSPYNWPYAPNVHEEAGLYIQFIYDHYHDLPDKMLFLHGDPFGHTPHPIEAALCVRDDVHYANINSLSFKDRAWSVWPRDKTDNIALMYKCALYVLSLFGFDGEAQLNPENITPKDDNVISAKCCGQFFVTKERIRHYTYEQWSAVYQANLKPYCASENAVEITGERDIKWFGGSFEHLWHVILGLNPTNMHIPLANTHSDECHLFRSPCQGSPCANHT